MRSILIILVAIIFATAIMSARATVIAAPPTLPPTPSCSSLNPPAVQSTCCSPIQLMFVMDNSNSMSQADLQAAYSFTKLFRCSFPNEANLQLGMVSFNHDVKLAAPLKMYNHVDWYNQVDTVFNTTGKIPQSTFTPMAEAFNLTREVFARAIATSINPNCTAQAIPVIRVAIVFTDGKPVQNVATDPVPGFPSFETDWQVVNQDSADYSENTVPDQAQKLKDLGVRVIFLGLQTTTAGVKNEMEPGYFAGKLIESRKCNKIKNAKDFPDNFCKNKLGNPPNLAVQTQNSQCYQKRDTVAPNVGSFMNENQPSGWACWYRDPNNNKFPIASTPQDVFVFQTPTGDLTNQLLAKLLPSGICPDKCFLQ